MTFNMLMSEMTMASLLSLSGNGGALTQDRTQATEAVLARLSRWDGQVIDLDTEQRDQLDSIVRIAA